MPSSSLLLKRVLPAVLVVPLAAACGSEKAGTGSATAETEPVTGIRWTIDSLTVDGATHRAPDGADLTLDEDGRATGSYGCNLFKGRVTFEGDRIRFGGDRETTLRACPEKIMDFESLFMSRNDGEEQTVDVTLDSAA